MNKPNSIRKCWFNFGQSEEDHVPILWGGPHSHWWAAATPYFWTGLRRIPTLWRASQTPPLPWWWPQPSHRILWRQLSVFVAVLFQPVHYIQEWNIRPIKNSLKKAIIYNSILVVTIFDWLKNCFISYKEVAYVTVKLTSKLYQSA